MTKAARIQELEKALVRAVKDHGHSYNCSAARGMERDCHCGWLEIKEMVKRIAVSASTQHNVTGD